MFGGRECSPPGMTDSARCGTADREAELISPEVADSLAVRLLGDLRTRTGGLPVAAGAPALN